MKIDKLGNLVSWEDMRPTLLEVLKPLNYEETIEQYSSWNDYFQSYQHGEFYADWMRSMVMCDRYFLLTHIIFLEKDRHMALHPWLFARCREVEAEPDDYLDLWARSHLKTTIITECGSIQEILNDPEITIAIFSYTKGAAIKIIGNIRRHLEGETLKSLFPDILHSKPERDAESWTKERLVVKRNSKLREPTIEACGVVLGMPTGSHFKLRIYDDLVTAESVATPEQIQKTSDMLALSDNLGMKGGRVRFIGTRYSLGDTYQFMMNRNQVKVRIYPATDDGTIDGVPVYLTQEEWDLKKRDQDTATLSCQMLQNPNAGSRAMFDISKVSFYTKRPNLLTIYILVDPSRGKKKGSDKTAMAVIGVDSSYRKFLLGGVHHRMGLAEKWEHLKRLYKQWLNADGVQSVQVGYEVYGMQSDTDYFAEQMVKEGPDFEIVELNGRASKIDRMSRLEPDIRNGRLFLPSLVKEEGKYKEIKMGKDDRGELVLKKRILSPKDIESNDSMLNNKFAVRPISNFNEDRRPYDLTLDFISQAKQVPNNSSHDDLVDAMSRIYDMEIFPPSMLSKGSLYQPTMD